MCSFMTTQLVAKRLRQEDVSLVIEHRPQGSNSDMAMLETSLEEKDGNRLCRVTKESLGRGSVRAWAAYKSKKAKPDLQLHKETCTLTAAPDLTGSLLDGHCCVSWP
jgi:hypothetical protein